MTIQGKRDSGWGGEQDREASMFSIQGGCPRGRLESKPTPIIYPTLVRDHSQWTQNHKLYQLTRSTLEQKLWSHTWTYIVSRKCLGLRQILAVSKWARERGVKTEFGAGSAVLLKSNEPFKGSEENKSTEWAVMVSQGDITLLQRITQPEARSQSASGSAHPAIGERDTGEEGYSSPLHTAHCTGTGPPFRGKQGFWAHPGLAGNFVMKMQMKVQACHFCFKWQNRFKHQKTNRI